MSNTEKAFIDYYEKNNIIPVRQDVSDLNKHFKRRESLYLHLGVPPHLLKNKSIIEFGPGSGDNAIYTASLEPSLYVLVDGNKSSVESVKTKVEQYFSKDLNYEVHYANLFSYDESRKFDLVICEGALPGQLEPEKFLKQLTHFVENKGLLFITTTSACSLLSEICRRMVKPFLFNQDLDIHKNTQIFVEFFKEDLLSLKGMSRLHEDWVLDSILHPWQNTVFSIGDAISTIQNEFDIYATSPKFFTDWRWYKSIAEDSQSQNEYNTKNYYNNLINFLDYRANPIQDQNINGYEIEKLAQQAFDIHVNIWENNDQNAVISQFLPIIQKLSSEIKPYLPETTQSLLDFIDGINSLQANKNADMKSFKTFFGRGQQYVSFIKKS